MGRPLDRERSEMAVIVSDETRPHLRQSYNLIEPSLDTLYMSERTRRAIRGRILKGFQSRRQAKSWE
ncbi:MAG TPA: hypothetical protein EYP65_01320 [Armatimonadetes bacterium]|nr:hypothetical protein [Armatimonadota bacterium]